MPLMAWSTKTATPELGHSYGFINIVSVFATQDKALHHYPAIWTGYWNDVFGYDNEATSNPHWRQDHRSRVTPSLHQTQFYSGCDTVLFHAALNTTGSISLAHFYWFSLWLLCSYVGSRKRNRKKKGKTAFFMISVWLPVLLFCCVNRVCVCV